MSSTKAICLGDVYHATLRTLLGNRCFISGAIAIGGTTTEGEIAAAIDYCIDGVLYHKAIADDLFVHTDLTVQAIGATKWYALCMDASGAGSIIQGTATALPVIPDNLCIVGALKIVNTSSVFTPATTAHTTVTTYYNLSCVPVAGVPS